jgi:hypothetical protein
VLDYRLLCPTPLFCLDSEEEKGQKKVNRPLSRHLFVLWCLFFFVLLPYSPLTHSLTNLHPHTRVNQRKPFAAYTTISQLNSSHRKTTRGACAGTHQLSVVVFKLLFACLRRQQTLKAPLSSPLPHTHTHTQTHTSDISSLFPSSQIIIIIECCQVTLLARGR